MQKVTREKLIEAYGYTKAHSALPEGTPGHIPNWIPQTIHEVLYPNKPVTKKPSTDNKGLGQCAAEPSPLASHFDTKAAATS